MPTKKVTPAAFTKMEAKVEALEGEMSEVRSMLADVQNAVKENHASLIAMLEKCLGKSLSGEEGSASFAGKTTSEIPVSSEKAKGTSSSDLRGDVLAEFRQSVKKVELPPFDGEDPAGWIS